MKSIEHQYDCKSNHHTVMTTETSTNPHTESSLPELLSKNEVTTQRLNIQELRKATEYAYSAYICLFNVQLSVRDVNSLTFLNIEDVRNRLYIAVNELMSILQANS